MLTCWSSELFLIWIELYIGPNLVLTSNNCVLELLNREDIHVKFLDISLMEREVSAAGSEIKKKAFLELQIDVTEKCIFHE